ncbi:hypothetical protein ACHAWO_005072 [Cyclotella atomus]|uniref:Uncharacterized protein n=1 Tax=Cyclotella atomus TaxID=382360 RepID=A0ABD3PBU7_9STRA
MKSATRPSPKRSSSGLHSSFAAGDSSNKQGCQTKWVCDRCGIIIDKRKYSHDEAAEGGYNAYECGGACDHAEQTLRIVDN